MYKKATVAVWLGGLGIFAYECGLIAALGLGTTMIADAFYRVL